MVAHHRIFYGLKHVLFSIAILTTIAFPLVVDTRLVNAFIAPKVTVLLGAILLSVLALVAGTVMTKHFEFRRSPLDLPIAVLIACAVLSGLFSGMIGKSFFGYADYFSASVLYLVGAALFYFLLVQVLTSPQRLLALYTTVVGVGGITAALFIARTLFHFDVVALLSSHQALSTTLEGYNGTFGVWLVVIFVLSAGQLLKKRSGIVASVLYGLAALLAFVAVVLLSFKIVWWVMFVALALLLLLGLRFIREVRLPALSVLFALLILVIIFIIFDTPRALQQVVPIETGLNFRSSWIITSQTMLSGVKNALIGSGPGTFAADFSQFRTTEFNADPLAGIIRFRVPSSSLLGLLAEGGIFSILSVILLTGVFIGKAVTSWFRIRSEDWSRVEEKSPGFLVHWETCLAIIGWVVLTAGSIMFFYGPVLSWLWWLLLAIAVCGFLFIAPESAALKKMVIPNKPEYALSFSFAGIVAMMMLVFVGVWGVRGYVAEVYYGRALSATEYAQAETGLKKALELRPNSDRFHLALAQIYLLQATQESRLAKPDLTIINTLMGRAVSEARRATELNPGSVTTWENLATMYENTALIIPTAREWAIKSLEEAAKREPTNPVFPWRLGNNYAVSGKYDEAQKKFDEALILKPDYTPAIISLGDTYEQAGKSGKAVETYKNGLAQTKTNVEILFNYGRVLHNRNQGNDRQLAKEAWLEAVRLEPNYSNALYSLALAYESEGETALALEYYNRVKELNPSNQDVIAKIEKLLQDR